MHLFWQRYGRAARCLGQLTVSTLCTLALLAGCATLNQIIQTPTATFDILDLGRSSLLESTLIFNFKANTPNPINIRASRITYDLKLNGQNFLRGQLDQGLSLPACSMARLRIPMEINYLDFFKTISRMMQARTAAYDLLGRFEVGPLTIPFNATGTLDLPQLAKFSLERINIRKLSWSGANLDKLQQMG